MPLIRRDLFIVAINAQRSKSQSFIPRMEPYYDYNQQKYKKYIFKITCKNNLLFLIMLTFQRKSPDLKVLHIIHWSCVNYPTSQPTLFFLSITIISCLLTASPIHNFRELSLNHCEFDSDAMSALD